MDNPAEVAATPVATEAVEAAPEAPVVDTPTEETPAPAAVEAEAPAPIEEAVAPKSRREAKEAMMQRIAEDARRKAQAEDQPRNKDGTFAQKEPRVVEEVAAPEGAATAVPDEAASPVAESVPGGAPSTIKIALDERSPLYDQGRQEIELPVEGLDENQRVQLERDIRTLANAAVRSREARATQEEAMRQVAMLQARIDVLQSGDLPSPANDPELARLMQDIETHYPGQHELMQQAVQAYQQSKVGEREQEAVAVYERQAVARNFIMGTDQVAGQKYPVWAQSGELAQRMQAARAQYGDYVDARNANLAAVGRPEQMPNEQEFFGWVDTHYVQDPRVQNQLKQFQSEQGKHARQQAATAERQRLAEAERQKMQEAAARQATAPPSPPAVASQGVVAPPPEGNPAMSAPHGNRQKALRQSVRQRLQQRQG